MCVCVRVCPYSHYAEFSWLICKPIVQLHIYIRYIGYRHFSIMAPISVSLFARLDYWAKCISYSIRVLSVVIPLKLHSEKLDVSHLICSSRD